MKAPDIPWREVDALIDEWIWGDNAERDRAIIRRKLYSGIKFEQLAEEFDLSVQSVKKIVNKGRKKIFRHIPG